MRFYNFFFFLMTCFLFFSCRDKEKCEAIVIHFTQTIDNKPIQYNRLIYANTAGNQFQVNEVKYFISKLIFKDVNGNSFEVKQNNGIHYVDNSIQSTLRWQLFNVPEGEYCSVSFVFGLDENDNQSNCFVNPPESNFSWPDVLGGGYHYMQINGKFKNNNGEIQNMNIHTGIGQIYNENNEIQQFVHNHFTVTLPAIFYVNENQTPTLTLNMEIQRWFGTPNLYNFDEFGTGIMQNQHAQQLLKENGENVFDVMISGQ